jgi:ABC-type bacteriocin/lantibiotic exporter with double-glycine peptidase domain
VKPIKQRDLTDCGVACLAIASHYNLRLSVARIRQLSGTDQSGTTVFGLVQASKQLGFVAKAVRANVDQLSSEVAFPAIAHVTLREDFFHYVVVLKVRKDRVTVMDPATGRFSKCPIDEFKKTWTGVLILLAPGAVFEPSGQRQSRLAWYLHLIRPHRSALVQAGFGPILVTLLALAGSFYIEKVVDSVIVESNSPLLNLLSVSMLLVLAFQVILNVGQSLLLTRSGQHIDLTLILAYYRHLFTLPQSFFDGLRVGEMISRINDAVKIRAFLNQQGTNLIICTLTLVFAVLVMFVFSWKLALLSLAFLAVYSLLFAFAVLRNRLYSRRIMEQSADFDAQVVESLETASTLRRFDRQWVAEMKTESLFVRLLSTTYSSGLFSISVNSVGTIIVQGFTIALLWIGASSVIQTQMSPGQLLSCFALTGYLTGPANNLLSIIVSALEVQVAADRLFEILDLGSEKDSGSISVADIKPLEIRLENVSFAYPGRLPVFNRANVCFLPGELTLLRGESGCGKSSVLALLQRLYTPTEGRIFFGPYEIQYLRLSSLRTQIAVVPQKIDLMSGTVTENITLGEFEPDLQRILGICAKLGLLEFIQSLPAGLDTRLAENGRNLSGGQRQRLAMARALYIDAPIYLFDEPTSALDEASVRLVLNVLRELRDLGKMVILVAHDSRFIPFADRVYRVSHGVIEEEPVVGVHNGEREETEEVREAEVRCVRPDVDLDKPGRGRRGAGIRDITTPDVNPDEPGRAGGIAPNQQIVVSVPTETRLICRLDPGEKFSGVRPATLALPAEEDPGFRRLRDRLEPSLRKWVNRGCRNSDLVRSAATLSDAEVLLRNFRASLTGAMAGYLEQSLKMARNRRRLLRRTVALAGVVGLAVPPLTVPAFREWISDLQRKALTEWISRFQGNEVAESAAAGPGAVTSAAGGRITAQLPPQSQSSPDLSRVPPTSEQTQLPKPSPNPSAL